ncbi:MAG TPA: phosphatidylglycerophosphatase A [candidate division Zixibacteria bacterium]|nr:phosphatidylglycerophosphatase A [candidate division Zixibacteria bacterium]
MKTTFAKLIATGLYSGFGRPYPGTWGTIPAWLIAYFLIRGDQMILGIVAAVTFVVSVWSAGEAEKVYGHDARKIVIDEWTGMFITLILVPYSLPNYLIAFVAFRGFDVIKIPPARQSEKLPGGWGITMDDVVAGIQACLGTHIAIYFLTQWGYL